MVDFAAEERVVLVYQAVLAKTLRTICNEAPQFFADVATHGQRTDGREP